MKTLQQIYQAITALLSSYFESDTDIISPQARRILSNKEDAKKYIQAIEDLKNNDRVTIVLSDGEELTLINAIDS